MTKLGAVLGGAAALLCVMGLAAAASAQTTGDGTAATTSPASVRKWRRPRVGPPRARGVELHLTPPSIVLHGEVKGSQNHTYIEVPFTVPEGLDRLTVRYRYTEKIRQHTAIDIGLLDPERLRCWAGGAHPVLTLSLSDATPSCLPGPLPSGVWNVLLGVPNIRPGVISDYTIQIYFTRSGLVSEEPEFLRTPLRAGPAWYRGDLHMHTANSDAKCPSQTGKMVPCPVFLTVEAAAKRGLDFIAVTDHNATSQYEFLRELQPYFDKVLLIPGREITTFYGHMNFLGTTSYIDFRLGSKSVPDINTFLRRADKMGALVSINHPDAPSGEACMGCGWTPAWPVDMRLFAAVEAVNGGSEMGGYNGVPFWNKQLNAGYRLPGIGGSDNHNATIPLDRYDAVGMPTTVVHAADLSTPAILSGIRAGHVFIDLTGSRTRMLTMEAAAAGRTAEMGDLLDAPAGTPVSFTIHETGGGQVQLIEDGRLVHGLPDAVNGTVRLTWTADGRRHWFRPQVTGSDGALLMIGNPVYVDWRAAVR